MRAIAIIRNSNINCYLKSIIVTRVRKGYYVDMNEKIRVAVKAAMVEKKITQGDLSRALDIPRPSITRALSGRSGAVPLVWQKMLDLLQLELTVQPREGQGDA